MNSLKPMEETPYWGKIDMSLRLFVSALDVSEGGNGGLDGVEAPRRHLGGFAHE